VKNLAGSPEHADIESELRARLDRWMEETDDPLDTGERNPETGMLNLGQSFTATAGTRLYLRDFPAGLRQDLLPLRVGVLLDLLDDVRVLVLLEMGKPALPEEVVGDG